MKYVKICKEKTEAASPGLQINFSLKKQLPLLPLWGQGA